jgi:DHA2 family multidrug resistance protein-like MFS transporter
LEVDLWWHISRRSTLLARHDLLVGERQGLGQEGCARRAKEFDMTTLTFPPGKAARKEWIALLVLALPTLLLSMDVSVLYLALPRLAADLHATSIEQLWILDIYSFMVSGFLITMGNLGDRIGRRRLLLVGALGFGAASILAAYSTSPAMLIASRALLGIAGATLAPSSLALVRNMFQDPDQLARAVGVWFSCYMGGMLLGPILGGTLLEHFWWGSAFLVGVPVMALLLVAGPFLLPEYRDASSGRLDLASVPLSLATILPLIYGLKDLARSGVSHQAAVMIAIGLLVGTVFVRRQRRLANPLVDVSLFRGRMFNGAFSIMLLAGVVMAGISLMSALYLQAVAGLAPLQAGLRLIPQNVAMVIGFTLAPSLARRFATERVIAGGLALSAMGLLVETQVGPLEGTGVLVAGLIVAAFGISLPMALTLGVIMDSTPPERAGATASLFETGGQFGIALGVAVLGSLGTAVYRLVLEPSIPIGLGGADARSVLESLTEAIRVAHAVPAIGTDLLAEASRAFSAGLNAVAALGAAIFLGLAWVALSILGPARVTSRQPAPAGAADLVGAHEP